MKKRKAHFSRAADVELAEISLEQQVLREMILPQQPAKDKVTQDAMQSSSFFFFFFFSCQLTRFISYCSYLKS